MKIHPMPGCVYIKTQSQKVGGFDTSMRDSVVEYAEVIALPEHNVPMQLMAWLCKIFGHSWVNRCSFEVGDKIFVKGWAIDVIDFEGEKYEFCNLETNGILCKVSDEPLQ